MCNCNWLFNYVLKNTPTIVPRKYQLELLEDCKKANTILYLPTGSGKTYIATMLVKSMGDCLTKYVNKLFFFNISN